MIQGCAAVCRGVPSLLDGVPVPHIQHEWLHSQVRTSNAQPAISSCTRLKLDLSLIWHLQLQITCGASVVLRVFRVLFWLHALKPR